MKNISLHQLARMAGVSKTTASLILNGKSDRYKISPATKERVLKLAEEIGYKPNILARNLSMGKSMTVGLIVQDLQKHENAVLIENVSKMLMKSGYHPILGIAEDAGQAEKLITEMTERKVDGILLLGNIEIKKRVETEVPMVMIGNGGIDGISSVTADAESGVKKLIGYWYPRGKRTIGYVGLQKGNADLKKGFTENYIERFSMQGEHVFLLESEKDEKKLRKVLKKMLNKGFNAVLFENPELVITALKFLKEKNDSDFDDLSFGSFGHHPFFEITDRDVVFVNKLPDKIAEEGVSVLMEFMHEGQKESKAIKTEPEFSF